MSNVMGKKKPGRPKVDKPREREGENLNVWLPSALMAAFEQSRRNAKRTKKAHIEFILEKFLAGEDLWPPETTN